jgi:hypothetical protein
MLPPPTQGLHRLEGFMSNCDFRAVRIREEMFRDTGECILIFKNLFLIIIVLGGTL